MWRLIHVLILVVSFEITALADKGSVDGIILYKSEVATTDTVTAIVNLPSASSKLSQYAISFGGASESYSGYLGTTPRTIVCDFTATAVGKCNLVLLVKNSAQQTVMTASKEVSILPLPRKYLPDTAIATIIGSVLTIFIFLVQQYATHLVTRSKRKKILFSHLKFQITALVEAIQTDNKDYDLQQLQQLMDPEDINILASREHLYNNYLELTSMARKWLNEHIDKDEILEKANNVLASLAARRVK